MSSAGATWGVLIVFPPKLMVLPDFLVVFFFLLFPTFRRFAGTLLQLTPGSGCGLFGVLGHFVGGFANFICRGVPVAFFSFPLRFPLALAGAGAGAQAQQGQKCHLGSHHSSI